MKNKQIFIVVLMILFSIDVGASYPSFFCDKNITENQKKICNDLLLSVAEGLDYKLRDKFKDKTLTFNKSYDSEYIISNFNKNIQIILQDLNDTELLVEYEKNPVFNVENSNKFILLVHYLITKEEAYKNGFLNKAIIELTKILKTTSFNFAEDADTQGEYLIIDVENDGLLDLIEVQTLGSLHVPHIFKMCRGADSLVYKKCPDELGYGFNMHGRFIKTEDDFIDYFRNDYIGDVAYGEKWYYLQGRAITERSRRILNKHIQYECSVNWLKFLYEKNKHIYEKSRPNLLNNECSVGATDEVLFSLIDLNLKNKELDLCRINLNKIKNKNDKYKKYIEQCNASGLLDNKV